MCHKFPQTLQLPKHPLVLFLRFSGGSAGTPLQDGCLGSPWLVCITTLGRAEQTLPAREFCSEVLHVILASSPSGHQGFPVCDHSAL